MQRNVSTPNLIADSAATAPQPSPSPNLLGGSNWCSNGNLPRNVSTPNLNQDPFADLRKYFCETILSSCWIQKLVFPTVTVIQTPSSHSLPCLAGSTHSTSPLGCCTADRGATSACLTDNTSHGNKAPLANIYLLPISTVIFIT